MTLTYVVSGFAVGLLVGLTGVGGGSLMTPLLTLFFGINPTVAVGTDLAFAAITKSAGTIAHRVKNNVHWDIVKRLCLGALPAAVVATIGLKYFGALDKHIGQIIRYAIAFSVILTVIAIIFRGRMQAWMNAHPEKQLHGRVQVAATSDPMPRSLSKARRKRCRCLRFRRVSGSDKAKPEWSHQSPPHRSRTP